MTDNQRMEAFEENALAPKRVETDSGKVEQHSVGDQIKALEYMKKQKVESSRKSQMSRFGFYKRVSLD